MYNTLRLVVICPSMGLHKLLWLNRHNILNTVQSDQLVQACGSGNVVSVASLLNGGAMVDSIGTDEFGVSDVIYHSTVNTVQCMVLPYCIMCKYHPDLVYSPFFGQHTIYIHLQTFSSSFVYGE